VESKAAQWSPRSDQLNLVGTGDTCWGGAELKLKWRRENQRSAQLNLGDAGETWGGFGGTYWGGAEWGI